jgi:putative colanic acid biosynthesis acetyltransferase WcaF
MEKVENYTPVQTTPFKFKLKIKSKIWSIVNVTLFKYSPFFCRKWRVFLVRVFGGDVHLSCSLNRLSRIDHPWNLKMDRLSSIGEKSWIYCLDSVSIGEKSCIGKEVYLLTGSHIIDSNNFELITSPIFIGNCVWVSTKSIVLPSVKIENFSVIAAGSVVVKNVETYSVVGGNPAKFIKKRIINE